LDPAFVFPEFNDYDFEANDTPDTPEPSSATVREPRSSSHPPPSSSSQKKPKIVAESATTTHLVPLLTKTPQNPPLPSPHPHPTFVTPTKKRQKSTQVSPVELSRPTPAILSIENLLSLEPFGILYTSASKMLLEDLPSYLDDASIAVFSTLLFKDIALENWNISELTVFKNIWSGAEPTRQDLTRVARFKALVDRELVVFSFNKSGNHWVLALLCYVNETDRTLFYFDSFGASPNYVEGVRRKIQSYFDRRKVELCVSSAHSLNQEELQNQSNVQQKNQCGIFYIRALQVVVEVFRQRGRHTHVGLVEEFKRCFPRNFRAKEFRERLSKRLEVLLERGEQGDFNEGYIHVRASRSGI
jgi:hypothetical protein